MSSPRLAVAALALSVLAARAAASERGPIQDNSFLIEEAYNQEAGVIQHISTFNRSVRTHDWAYSFTEEWPVLGQTHQASITFNYAQLGAQASVGDLALNYRCQLIGDGDAPVAFSPRLTLLVPSGDAARGFGTGGAGMQVNLPLSAVLAKQLVTHLNVGATYVPSARSSSGSYGPLTALAVGQSLVWLAHSRINVLVEALYTRSETAARTGLHRFETLTINPGLRAAIDFASGLQIVPGVGVPIGIGPSRGETGLFFYLSFEHPFRAAGPTSDRP